METRVLFLRGINVGGRNVLPMSDLRALLSEIGLGDVRTHIQSGNAVFRAPAGESGPLAQRITDAIGARFGIRPAAFVLAATELERVLAEMPFPGTDPARVHVWLLSGPPDPGAAAALERLRAPSESVRLAPHALYLDAPDGIGRSALANRAERVLGVDATARTLRTMEAVRRLATPGSARQ